MDCKKYRYVAFIDESGDEGFKFSEGSSEWFILSAVVVDADREHELMALVDAARAEMRRKDTHPLHFTKLCDKSRHILVKHIARANIAAMSVLIHKPSVHTSGLSLAPRMYFYCTRLLLERISWWCRERAREDRSGDCRARIVFSDRSQTPYPKLLAYLEHIRASDRDNQVHWPAISTERMVAIPHHKLKSLQVVDAVAGAMHFAARSAKKDPSYARVLMPITYNRSGNFTSYGVKVLPSYGMLAKVGVALEWIGKQTAA